MSAKYSLERDLAELEQMVERLRDFVLGDRLYMPLASGYSRSATTPQLSTGALLLRRRRLMFLRASLSASQQARLESALEQHDVIQREWTVHYEGKLKQEAPARLKQMHGFFRDCQDSPSSCASAYPVEALRRTIVQEIVLAMDEFGYDSAESRARVPHTDTALRRLLFACEFIWAAPLEAVYPRGEYWWLYGVPGAD